VYAEGLPLSILFLARVFSPQATHRVHRPLIAAPPFVPWALHYRPASDSHKVNCRNIAITVRRDKPA